MATINADLELCQGYANCVVAAGDFFDISDDGKVIVNKDHVSASELVRIHEAARSCPVSALAIVDEE